jgi:hypothetical protein
MTCAEQDSLAFKAALYFLQKGDYFPFMELVFHYAGNEEGRLFIEEQWPSFSEYVPRNKWEKIVSDYTPRPVKLN